MASRIETIGNATLYLGDCREILPTLRADVVVADPPYGIGHHHSGKSGGKWKISNSRPIIGDSAPFDPSPFLNMPCLFFGADHFCGRLPPGGIIHVWDKECGRSGRNDSFSDAELFWTSHACKRRVIRYMWKGLQVEQPLLDQRREHPTQKPVSVMAQCIEMMPSGIVLDPFMGSGTTGVAALKLGRQFIGIEIEPKYFDIACRRLAEANKQPDIFIKCAAEPKQLDLSDASAKP